MDITSLASVEDFTVSPLCQVDAELGVKNLPPVYGDLLLDEQDDEMSMEEDNAEVITDDEKLLQKFGATDNVKVVLQRLNPIMEEIFLKDVPRAKRPRLDDQDSSDDDDHEPVDQEETSMDSEPTKVDENDEQEQVVADEDQAEADLPEEDKEEEQEKVMPKSAKRRKSAVFTTIYCPMCSKPFKNSLAKEKHIKKSHTRVPCEICGKVLLPGSMRYHRTKIHGFNSKNRRSNSDNEDKENVNPAKPVKAEDAVEEEKVEKEITDQEESTNSSEQVEEKEDRIAENERDSENMSKVVEDQPEPEQVPEEGAEESISAPEANVTDDDDSDRHTSCPSPAEKATAKTEKCPKCDKMFNDDNLLALHVAFLHRSKFLAPARIDNKPSVSCQQCGQAFVTKERLTIHMRLAHQTMIPYECLKCGQEMKDMDTLNHHKEQVHQEEPPNKCNQCDQGFWSKFQLYSHSKTHANGNINVRCLLCPGKWFSPWGLDFHERVTHQS